jgi:hypothetical protein
MSIAAAVGLRKGELSCAHPSERAISIEVSNAWGWVQPNGTLCDALCRGLLLALHRSGALELPAPKKRVRAATCFSGALVVIHCTAGS